MTPPAQEAERIEQVKAILTKRCPSHFSRKVDHVCAECVLDALTQQKTDTERETAEACAGIAEKEMKWGEPPFNNLIRKGTAKGIAIAIRQRFGGTG